MDLLQVLQVIFPEFEFPLTDCEKVSFVWRPCLDFTFYSLFHFHWSTLFSLVWPLGHLGPFLLTLWMNFRNLALGHKDKYVMVQKTWNCKNIAGRQGLSLPAEWLHTGAALGQRGQNWNWRTSWSLYKEKLRMKDQIIGSSQSKTEAIKLSCMWKNHWAVRRYQLSCQCISFIEWWPKHECFFFILEWYTTLLWKDFEG